MDKLERWFTGYFVFVLILAVAVLCLFGWGFIELILWITSK